MFKGMFVTNGDVLKTVVYSLFIWFSGGACWRSNMPQTLSTIGGVVLLEIVVKFWVCAEAFCVNMATEDIDPSTVCLRNSHSGAVVMVEPSCCSVSPISSAKMGVVIGFNDIIDLIGLVGVPLAPSVSPVVILWCW